jgi:glycosyltransferase involved in cell wall biosynthesis
MYASKKFSFVIPCYRSVKNLEIVIKKIQSVMLEQNHFSYEIILVNDCSPDATWSLIQKLCKEDSHIKGIDLAKNVGQAGALMAGFQVAQGDYIITAEDDGQSSIEKIWDMYHLLDDNVDIVCAKNISTPHRKFIRRFGARVNHLMLDVVLEKPKDISPSIFFIAKKSVIQEMLHYQNPYPYIPGLILRSTSKITNYEIQRPDRLSGESNYSFKKLLGLWMNGITAFSIKPLRIASFLGILFSGVGFLSVILQLIRYFICHDVLPGYTSTIIIMLIIGGIILIVLGIIGEYVGRIYMCISNEPQYIIREIITENKEN